jgi:hypothetical protein
MAIDQGLFRPLLTVEVEAKPRRRFRARNRPGCSGRRRRTGTQLKRSLIELDAFIEDEKVNEALKGFLLSDCSDASIPDRRWDIVLHTITTTKRDTTF